MSEPDFNVKSLQVGLQIDRKKFVLTFVLNLALLIFAVAFLAYKTQIGLSITIVLIVVFTMMHFVFMNAIIGSLPRNILVRHPFCVFDDEGVVVFSSYSKYVNQSKGIRIPKNHLRMINGKIGQDVFIRKAYYYFNSQPAELLEITDQESIKKLSKFFDENYNFGIDSLNTFSGKSNWAKSPLLLIENFSQKHPFCINVKQRVHLRVDRL